MKSIKKNKIIKIAILIILPWIVELIFSKKISFEKDTLLRLAIYYSMEAIYLVYKILEKNSKIVNKVLDFIIDKRYIIITIIFIIGVAFKINFSSIDVWAKFLNEEEIHSNILGVARTIRSDEWLVQTPIFLAQSKNEDGYAMRNNHIMQGNFNALMDSAPVFSICTISKPFVWGFILFGTDYGFSWWWMLRYLLLLIVSFEFARILSKRDKLLSIMGMCLLAFAPAMMWWFSTAVVDAYIWACAIIILFNLYMNNLNYNIWKKLLIALEMIISIPAFAFALYPAYQIPIAFIILIFVINDFVVNFKNIKKQDYIIIISTLLIVGLIILSFVINAWPAIQVMMNTVYPGKRFETGGNYTVDLAVSIFTNLFLPYSKNVQNPCELSGYIFPIMGLIVLIIEYFNKKINWKNIFKNDDFIDLGLITLFVIYSLWIFIGFNKSASKISLLYYSPAKRTILILGLIGTLLIIRLFNNIKKRNNINKAQAIIISLIAVFVAHVLIKNSSFGIFFTRIKLNILFVVIFSSTYTLLTFNKKAFTYIMTIVAIVAGATVNPIAHGNDIMYKTDIAKEIQNIYNEDKEALWIGRYNWSGQYLIANGVNTLNGVNIYPNFKWLNEVDPESKYNDIYNRYAHIGIILSDKTEFRLLSEDSYEVELKYDDIKKLGVKYYFTDQELSDNISNEFKAHIKYENEEKKQYIYEFE